MDDLDKKYLDKIGPNGRKVWRTTSLSPQVYWQFLQGLSDRANKAWKEGDRETGTKMFDLWLRFAGVHPQMIEWPRQWRQAVLAELRSYTNSPKRIDMKQIYINILTNQNSSLARYCLELLTEERR